MELFDNLVRRATNLIDLPIGRCRHFTFIVRKSRVVSMGWNHGYKTCPEAKRLGYRFCNIHSELHAMQNLPPQVDIRKCVIVNVRLNSFGELRLSKPCPTCLPWLTALGSRGLYYSTPEGFARL